VWLTARAAARLAIQPEDVAALRVLKRSLDARKGRPLGWQLRVEVHRAVAFDGDVRVEDPDGIVVDARFVPVGDCRAWLASTWLPTHEPLVAWLSERWTESRAYRYRVDGARREVMKIVRL